ncbi:hypothetical protein LT493_01595 [Streptomyces tricolor]|nr:hypothetical protein [Streptomyces tricolor]
MGTSRMPDLHVRGMSPVHRTPRRTAPGDRTLAPDAERPGRPVHRAGLPAPPALARRSSRRRAR